MTSSFTQAEIKKRREYARRKMQNRRAYDLPSPTNLRGMRRFAPTVFILILLFGISQASGVRFVDIGLEAVDHPSIVCSPPRLFERGRSFALPVEGRGKCPWITSTSHYKGGSAIGTEVSPSLTNKDRSEIKVVRGTDNYALHFGQTRYFGFAMHADTSSSDWPLKEDVIFMQVWQANCGPKVPLTASLQTGTGGDLSSLAFSVAAYENQFRSRLLTSFPIRRGWHSFLFKLSPSYDNTRGRGEVDLWLDGVKIVSWRHNWGGEPGKDLGFGSVRDLWNVKCGIYRPHPAKQKLVLIFDNIRYADNFRDATP